MATAVSTCPRCGQALVTDNGATICPRCGPVQQLATARYMGWRPPSDLQGLGITPGSPPPLPGAAPPLPAAATTIKPAGAAAEGYGVTLSTATRVTTPAPPTAESVVTVDPADWQVNGMIAGALIGAAALMAGALFGGKTGLVVAKVFIGALIGGSFGAAFSWLSGWIDTFFPWWLRGIRWLAMICGDNDKAYIMTTSFLGGLSGLTIGGLVMSQAKVNPIVAIPLGAMGAAVFAGVIGSFAGRFWGELRKADEIFEARRRGLIR